MKRRWKLAQQIDMTARWFKARTSHTYNKVKALNQGEPLSHDSLCVSCWEIFQDDSRYPHILRLASPYLSPSAFLNLQEIPDDPAPLPKGSSGLQSQLDQLSRKAVTFCSSTMLMVQKFQGQPLVRCIRPCK